MNPLMGAPGNPVPGGISETRKCPDGGFPRAFWQVLRIEREREETTETRLRVHRGRESGQVRAATYLYWTPAEAPSWGHGAEPMGTAAGRRHGGVNRCLSLRLRSAAGDP